MKCIMRKALSIKIKFIVQGIVEVSSAELLVFMSPI